MRRRREAAELAAAAALDAVTSALRSGGTVRDGLEAAAEAQGKLAAEVRGVLRRAQTVPLRDALSEWARLHPASSVRLAASAMVVALDTGGSHAAMLEAVARRLRERAALAREIRVAAASARASATVIAVTPAAFGAVVLAVDRSVVSAALRSPVGRVSLVLGLALELAGALWMRRMVDARSQLAADADDGVAEVADLFSLALAAGLTTTDALAVIAPRVQGPAGRALRVSAARLAAGDRFVDEIATWASDDALGTGARPLVDALVAAHRDGAPSVEALDQVAADVRHAQRQQMNERVQRLPVLLLFPLVGCILPAFVLLAVMPVAVGSLVSMRAG